MIFLFNLRFASINRRRISFVRHEYLNVRIRLTDLSVCKVFYYAWLFIYPYLIRYLRLKLASLVWFWCAVLIHKQIGDWSLER